MLDPLVQGSVSFPWMLAPPMRGFTNAGSAEDAGVVGVDGVGGFVDILFDNLILDLVFQKHGLGS